MGPSRSLQVHPWSSHRTRLPQASRLVAFTYIMFIPNPRCLLLMSLLPCLSTYNSVTRQGFCLLLHTPLSTSGRQVFYFRSLLVSDHTFKQTDDSVPGKATFSLTKLELLKYHLPPDFVIIGKQTGSLWHRPSFLCHGHRYLHWPMSMLYGDLPSQHRKKTRPPGIGI